MEAGFDEEGITGPTGVEAGFDGETGATGVEAGFDDGITGPTGVEAEGVVVQGVVVVEGGMIGPTGVCETGAEGTEIGPVGPAGPNGCVPLWHPQFLGGASATLITAGTGTAGFTGAGSANAAPEEGYTVPFSEHDASPVVVLVWKQRAADFRPTGGRDESPSAQEESVPTLFVQWTMRACESESPAQ